MIIILKTRHEGVHENEIFFPAVVFIFVPLLTMCSEPNGPIMGGWKPGNMMNYGYGYGDVFMGLIFLIIIVVAIYFIVQALRSKNVIGQAQETHLDILKKRYAKGEITREDFDRMKKDLE